MNNNYILKPISHIKGRKLRTHGIYQSSSPAFDFAYKVNVYNVLFVIEKPTIESFNKIAQLIQDYGNALYFIKAALQHDNISADSLMKFINYSNYTPYIRNITHKKQISDNILFNIEFANRRAEDNIMELFYKKRSKELIHLTQLSYKEINTALVDYNKLNGYKDYIEMPFVLNIEKPSQSEFHFILYKYLHDSKYSFNDEVYFIYIDKDYNDYLYKLLFREKEYRYIKVI